MHTCFLLSFAYGVSINWLSIEFDPCAMMESGFGLDLGEVLEFVSYVNWIAHFNFHLFLMSKFVSLKSLKEVADGSCPLVKTDFESRI